MQPLVTLQQPLSLLLLFLCCMTVGIIIGGAGAGIDGLFLLLSLFLIFIVILVGMGGGGGPGGLIMGITG